MSASKGESRREQEQPDDLTQRIGDLTRREWLLRLGETITLLGFSGVASETPAAAASLLAGSAAAALPPGLYEPSNDHLSHALTSDGQFHSIPAGSETDYVQPRRGPFQPQFFSATEFKTVRRLVELMLGSVAGPAGASEGAGIIDEVAEWIDLTVWRAAAVREAARRLAPEHRILAVHHYGAEAVEEVENGDPQKICRDGLSWLSDESKGGEDFINRSEDEQVELLNRTSDARPDQSAENAGTRFLALIKAGVIRGFYTSRLGLKELDYKGNAFYAESPACPKQERPS